MLPTNVENKATRTWLQQASCPPAGLLQTELLAWTQTSGQSRVAQEAVPQCRQSAEDTASLDVAAMPMKPPIATCKTQTWKVLKNVSYMWNNIIVAERNQRGSMTVSVGRSNESTVKKWCSVASGRQLELISYHPCHSNFTVQCIIQGAYRPHPACSPLCAEILWEEGEVPKVQKC